MLLAVLIAGGVLDNLRPPPEQASVRGLVLAIGIYRKSVSPGMRFLGVRCRFEPSCSHYAEACLLRHGAIVGGCRAFWRVLRCGPWSARGTKDPPR